MSETSPRTSYNTGYGDFSFGRLIDRADIKLEKLDLSDPKDVKSLKPAWTQRFDSFPFMKLPLEVRHNIYRMILGPLYLSDMKTIHLRLSSTRENPQLTKNFFGDYAWYLEKQQRVVPRKHVTVENVSFYQALGYVPEGVNQPEVELMSKAEYEAEKKRLAEKDEKHPHRVVAYRIEVHAPSPQFGQRVYDKDFDLYVEWIRQFANTSTLIRKEFGDVFWLRVSIVSSDPKGPQYLQAMLRERPLIHKGVKSLDLSLDFGYAKRLRDHKKDFPAWCEEISSKVRLETLAFSLRLRDIDLTAYKKRIAVLRQVAASSMLPVEQDFELFLFADIKTQYLNLTGVQKTEVQRGMRRKWLELFRQTMMPFSLRQKQMGGDVTMSGGIGNEAGSCAVS